MGTCNKVSCEVCGIDADVVMNGHVNADGNRIEWPKAAVKADGIYFMIACPRCGQ